LPQVVIAHKHPYLKYHCKIIFRCFADTNKKVLLKHPNDAWSEKSYHEVWNKVPKIGAMTFFQTTYFNLPFLALSLKGLV
jgi:hypothetical protein